MEQQKGQTLPQTTLKKQPVICPWTAAQPYPSTHLNKNRNGTQGSSTPLTNQAINNHWSNLPISMDTSKYFDKTQVLPMQHSSSQFFYFLRLMELFPDTHPATLHTVLTLCKNNFFCAVDKLLYAKRCKALYNRRQNVFQRYSQSRNHPYYNVTRNTMNNNSSVGSNITHKIPKVSHNNSQQAESLSNKQNSTYVKEELNCLQTNFNKDDEEMGSPSEMQQQLKIPMKPLSPAGDDAEDLSSSSSTKVEITVQD